MTVKITHLMSKKCPNLICRKENIQFNFIRQLEKFYLYLSITVHHQLVLNSKKNIFKIFTACSLILLMKFLLISPTIISFRLSSVVCVFFFFFGCGKLKFHSKYFLVGGKCFTSAAIIWQYKLFPSDFQKCEFH